MKQSTIPGPAWVIAALLGVLMYLGMFIVFNDASPPFRMFIPLLPAVAVGAWTILLGYIYGDARRRGMNAVMWLLLAALAPSAIGVILYFILRDPVPIYCSRCGTPSRPAFVHCPSCGAPLKGACPQCGKPVQDGWTHCAWCGCGLLARADR